jgi:predicted ATPase/class 3 adenylate cyclase
VPTPSALLTLHCAIDNIPLLVDANAVSALEVARVLVMTDIVDSTATTLRLGDRNAAALWASHDRIARDLLQPWRGREIDKSDGFLLLFETVADALGYATAYHATLAASEPPLQSRAAIHLGPLSLRENPPHDVARGAKPIEADGVAKSTAARIMALARPGQTLMSAAARTAFSPAPGMQVRSHGHWRFKGLDEAIELFEAGSEVSQFAPPPDGAKGWRVVRRHDLWVPARELPHSLPAERDRFIDRVATLAELAARFARGARLLSVLGTGGAGKTRLALRFGWTWLGDFAGGVWFCDLSAARDFDGIVHATAHGLRLELVGADPVRQIGDAIAGRGESLVIVDNFEQVAAHAETAIGRWLERAPAACFIVTTRERLGIVGEDTLQLPPLAVDDGAAMLRERAASAGAVPFTRHDEAAVPELVALLDGLPLAIELAASRIRVLPPAQLLPRMGERFSVLTGSRGRHDRQATLRATLDWSWGLLTKPERAALARLSVFENGFGLDAASAVVDLSAFFPASSVVETVQSLLDKSLLRNVGPDRFDLLRSVQDYAAERLTEAARAATANSHAKHFLDWLGDLRPAIERSDRDTLRRLDADFANCRAAWLWAAAHGHVEALMRSTASLLHFCDHRGRFEECRALLRTAIEAWPPDADPRFEPRLSSAVAHLEYRLDRYRDAEATAMRALASSRRTRDAETRLQCFKVLGACCIALGGHASAERHLKRALRRSLAQGDVRSVADMLDNLALVEKALGHYDESLRLSMQSLQQYRRLGHVAGEALCLNNIGAMQMDRGEYEAAGSHLRAGLALSELHDLVSTRGLLLANLTELAVKTDATQAAKQYAGLALELARHIGARTVESWLEMQLAQIALRNGEPAGARLHLRSSLEISIDIDRPALRLAGVSVFAEILAAEGHLDCARRVLAFAAEHPSMPANGRDDLLARLARWGTTPETASWPGLDLAALVDRIVVETDVAHAPLIALLNERR